MRDFLGWGNLSTWRVALTRFCPLQCVSLLKLSEILRKHDSKHHRESVGAGMYTIHMWFSTCFQPQKKSHKPWSRSYMHHTNKHNLINLKHEKPKAIPIQFPGNISPAVDPHVLGLLLLFLASTLPLSGWPRWLRWISCAGVVLGSATLSLRLGFSLGLCSRLATTWWLSRGFILCVFELLDQRPKSIQIRREGMRQQTV